MSSDIENQQKNNNETNNINNDISLELAKKKLKLANLIHRDFVKDVALNIKDPSTGIFEHNVALSSAENDPLKKQSINDITDCAAELMDYSQEIIVDFIDYHSSLMDSTNTVLVPKISKKFNPRKLVNRIITKLTPIANYKGIHLVNDFYRDITPIITGDRYRIEAILMQLVSNALKFTNKGGVFVLTSHAPRILESQNDDNEEATEEKENKAVILQFIVHDTGIGMSLDKQQYLYEQLNSLDNSTSQATREELQSKTSSESTFELGLGLSLVKQFIAELKGTIDISSDEGKGTSFTVQVPVK